LDLPKKIYCDKIAFTDYFEQDGLIQGCPTLLASGQIFGTEKLGGPLFRFKNLRGL
jgi:hypothetical protein